MTTKIKKVFITVISVLFFCTAMCGCNKDIIDVHYTYNYAIIQRADGEQTIKITSWRDYSDGDQIQITTEDGGVYLVHSSNIILANKIGKLGN